MTEETAADAKGRQLSVECTLLESGLTLKGLSKVIDALLGGLHATEREMTGKRRARKQYLVRHLVLTETRLLLAVEEQP